MVGFSMTHAFPSLLISGLIALLGGAVWLLVSTILLFRKRFQVPPHDWVLLLLLLMLITTLLVPWDKLMVEVIGPGTHGADFLVQAAAGGNEYLVARLLRRGCDINSEVQGGPTPLSAAAAEGRTDMIRFLISRGADINRHEHLTGETPLIGAAEMGQLQAVKILLMDGADPCATRFSGQTAGEVAQGRFDFTDELVYSDIAEYLSSRARCQK